MMSGMLQVLERCGRGHVCISQDGGSYAVNEDLEIYLIISFFRLNPWPSDLLGQPTTGQKCGLVSLWTFMWELRYCV